MKRKFHLFLPALFLLTASLCGCGGEENSSPSNGEILSDGENFSSPTSGPVELTVWGAAEDEELLNRILNEFQEKYRGEADFRITYEPQSESHCTDALMADLENGADVFAFADDQLNTLVASGALDPVENAEALRAANLPEAVSAACVNDTLYAYPLTADNGYFLYYNKEYFSPEDILSWDRMLDIAGDAGRKVSMEWSSGWYVYALFGNTGLTLGLNDDGITNYCTWNDTEGDIKGTDVAKAMTAMARHPGFLSTDDAGFVEGVKNGSIVAGISGVWNAVTVEEAWGDAFGAAKLPSYACAGQQVQMASFSGYKLIGVNAYSPHRDWAARLAEWITSEENQELRFEMRGQGPSNKKTAASREVQASPAIAALLEQSEYSCLQRIGGNFWEPVTNFTAEILAGNPSGKSLQELLDTMVAGIIAP
jgi:arabinogalactan oligomer/maltooligosaccharide transport system substrate-binding protein